VEKVPLMTSPPVVIVTGSSVGGIGASLATAFAARGCIVYATARKLESLEGLKNSFNNKTGVMKKLQLDVNSQESVQVAVETIIKDEGRIDILINNAGVPCVGPILDVSIEEAEDTFQTNVFAVMRMQRAVVPHMVARKSGLVINMGSITAIVPVPFGGVYAATKAALRSITETLYNECKPFNVDVMLIEAGAVRSNIGRNGAAKYALPPNSLYKSFLPNILGRMHVSQARGVMDTDEFASGVVAKALPIQEPYTVDEDSTALVRRRYGTPARYLSFGGHAFQFWIMSWLPRGMVLNLVWKRAQGFKSPPGASAPQ